MIQIDKLNFSYSKKKTLFDELDLQLDAGKIYGLLGKNGTGKSTLLKLLTGVLHPKNGQVIVDGQVAGKRNPEMLEDIFFLSEDYALPPISISSFLKAYAPFYKKFNHQQFDDFLNLFEVERNTKLNRLSYGQKKKVLISFGIATNARYLIMDEPTNGLDIPSKSQFRKVILSGFRDDQIMIISTHQVRDLDQLIESVIIIENGQMILNRAISELEQKLQFTKSFSDRKIDGSIHSEVTPGGYVHLGRNTSGEPAQVELEILFNAAIQNEQELKQLLN